jgi:ABC-type multidrug transport system ATPase subunit
LEKGGVMTSVISEIVDWADSKLKYWEQLALYKIMSGVTFDEQADKDLLQNLYIDFKLLPDPGKRPTINFDAFKKNATKNVSSNIQLCGIKNFQNVNALVQEQCLPIGPALTVVYGANGAGKSGYSRVLGCAGFMRGDVEVLANVNDPNCSNLTPFVEIEIEDDSGKRCVSYIPGQECTELNSLHVFDVKSVQEHLIKKNKFTFSPAGLSYLTTLAEVTDRIRDRLTNLITTHKKPEDYTTFFQGGDSSIKDMLKDLNSKTNLKNLKAASVLTDADKKQITALDKKIAVLKIKNIPKQITGLETTKTDLTSLNDNLNDLSNNLADGVAKKIKTGINEFNAADTLAKQLGIDQFKTEYFTQTGTKPWYDFAKAAKLLATKEQTEETPYPQDGDRCLLCHQPLTVESRELIHKLWGFLDGEVQAAVNKAEKSLDTFTKTLEKTTLDFFNDQSVSNRYLTAYDKKKKTKLTSTIKAFLNGCKERLETLTKMINDKDSKVILEDLPKTGVKQIKSVISILDTELEVLHKSNPATEIENLEDELRNLNHKKVLSAKYTDIEKYINKLIWLKVASKAGGTTRPITTKYNALFKRIVTGGYVKLFQNILDSLGRPIRIQVETKPRKGETFRQLMLETDSKTLPSGATPDSVLSEGEKRAVALADFLTEVDLDTGSGGIVLDDPVTSLDIEWISVIASLLVSEAKNRQVIVFTHNLTFIHSLKNYSNDHGIDVQMHWIKRGDIDDLPGYVYANNSPVLESDYKTTHKANEHFQKAKKLPPAEQENELKQGFGALRTTYEAFIIFTLLGGVVARWNERISPGRLKDIVWEKEFFQKIINKHESLSKYIEAHLHSDEYVPIKPTPELLNREIEEFNEIKKEHKVLKKTAT